MPGLDHTPSGPQKEIKKLVLCFDGTGNTFQGNTSDTNIVKIYDKLDRSDPNQFHYYQPGIGTYGIDGGSLNKGFIGNFTSNISKTIDEGLATSFDAHVMAGYRFLMRYYDAGDKIYLFGFSRGAFTARFLARMVNTIGLLSKGNDELVPFAYQLYQQYEQAKEGLNLGPGDTAHQDESKPIDPDAEDTRNKLNAFTSTFCRNDNIYDTVRKSYSGVKIYFLGIFDCVSSVSVLETPFGKTPKPVSVVGTAEHVRHAVATDEFRVKFKCALLNQDVYPENFAENEDVKEVWFPGNHGDVGGGWPAKSKKEREEDEKLGFWGKLRRYFTTLVNHKASKNAKFDPYQMSDIPLSWMIRELEMLGDQEPACALKWSKRLAGFKDNFSHEQALHADCHNTMAIGGGTSVAKVTLWNFMDYLPLFPRWELESTGWKMRTFPANMASARDMPKNVLLHASLVWRLQHKKDEYRPRNNHGGGSPPVLVDAHKFLVADDGAERQHKDVDHRIFALNQETVNEYKDNNANVVASTGVVLEPASTPAPVVMNGPAPTPPSSSPTTAKNPSSIAVGVTEIFH